jgi:hypothetical protein
MALLVSILILLMLGLGLFQAWQLWYTRRQLGRLEQRLAESLDDQDLLEFQDRLKGLLAETKDAGLDLVEKIEKRRAAIQQVIEEAAGLEKKLSMRTLELAARELGKAAGPAPKAKAAPLKKSPAVAEAPEPPPMEASENSVEEAASRSYLSRPASATAAPNRYQRVYELSDQGLTREQIAREAGLLPGEIELIINLRPGKRR